eukprot:6574185-Prymnesium_polylepis.1
MAHLGHPQLVDAVLRLRHALPHRAQQLGHRLEPLHHLLPEGRERPKSVRLPGGDRSHALSGQDAARGAEPAHSAQGTRGRPNAQRAGRGAIVCALIREAVPDCGGGSHYLWREQHQAELRRDERDVGVDEALVVEARQADRQPRLVLLERRRRRHR